MKRIILTLFLLSSTSGLKIQAQDYFIVKGDTTFCTDLEYKTTAQGYLKQIKFKDRYGNEVKIKGRRKVPDVLTFYIDSITIDKTPLKAHKPKGYIRYTERAVDGKLKVYVNQQRYNESVRYTPGSPNGDFTSGGPMGTYRFFLKMPDGTYYKINKKKNMKKYIKPYLLKCKAFREKYTGDFSRKEYEFMKMIRLYNSLCGNE